MPFRKSWSQLGFISLLWSLIVILAISIPHPVLVQGAEEEEQDCTGEMRTYFSSLLSQGSFKEYWKDFFSRNYCQRQDIFEIQDQMDQIRKDIREAYYDCNLEKAISKRVEFYKLEAELYYVRKVVDTEDLDALTEEDFEAYQAELSDFQEILKEEMEDYFGEKKNWLTSAELETYFEEFQAKYENRLESYFVCKGSVWDQIEERWNSLKEKFSSLKIEEKKEEEKEPKTEKGAKESIWSRMGNYLKKHLAFKYKQNVDPLKGLEEVWTEIQEEGKAVTKQELYEQYQAEQARYEQETKEADLMARYSLLYLEGGTSISVELADKIDQLNQIITNTTSNELAAVLQCAETVKKKQKCP